MILLQYFRFIGFLAYAFMAGYILYKNPKSMLNITCALLISSFAIWTIADPNSISKNITIDKVILLQNISSFGWISFASFFLCFTLVFSKREKLLKKKKVLILIFILPVILLYKQWTVGLNNSPVLIDYGWYVSWKESFWSYLFYVYYASFMLISIFIIYRYGTQTKIIAEKKQSKIVVITTIVILIAVTITDIIIPSFGIPAIPQLGQVILLVFAGGIIYAIAKYEFLTVSFAFAAENIISTMEELLILTDHEGNILNVNKAVINLLNYEQKELSGKSVAILFSESSLTIPLKERISRGEKIKKHEAYFLMKDANVIPVIFSCSPLKDKEGDIRGMVFIASDITVRKQAEEEIKLKNEELRKHIAEKDKFFSIIAHDLRSPFSGFLGLTKIMSEELPNLKMAEIQQIAVNMENSATNLYRLLENLLQWAKMQQGLIPFDPVVIHLGSIVSESLEMLVESYNNKGIVITYDIPVDIKVFADINMLQTVIRNLISNAMKFTPKGGKVTLSAKASGNNIIEISIQDSGIGMSPAMVDHLFKLNVQTNRKGTEGEPSSGLGLLLCKEFIEKIGGQIWVESEEGNGSLFHFTLPCSSEPEKKIVTTTIDLPNKKENQANREIFALKILIAEDDADSQMLISLAVKTLSKDILKVRTGFEAVEACRNNPDIDLVLMDIQMPQMDGYEATRQIRQFNKEVIIIAQTAYANKGDREKAIEAGCNDHITKPIKKAELVGLVKKYLKK